MPFVPEGSHGISLCGNTKPAQTVPTLANNRKRMSCCQEIEGGHAWRGQAQGIYLDKSQGPDPIAEDILFGLEPWRIIALGLKAGPLLSNTTGMEKTKGLTLANDMFNNMTLDCMPPCAG